MHVTSVYSVVFSLSHVHDWHSQAAPRHRFSVAWTRLVTLSDFQDRLKMLLDSQARLASSYPGTNQTEYKQISGRLQARQVCSRTRTKQAPNYRAGGQRRMPRRQWHGCQCWEAKHVKVLAVEANLTFYSGTGLYLLQAQDNAMKVTHTENKGGLRGGERANTGNAKPPGVKGVNQATTTRYGH